MVDHLRAVERGGLDGLEDGDARLVHEVVHLVDGDVAVGGHEAERVGADSQRDAELVGATQVGVGALQLALDDRLAGELGVGLGLLGRVGRVPGGQKADGRREEGPLLGHELHGLVVELEAVDELLAAEAHGVPGGAHGVVRVAPQRDAGELALVGDGLDLLGAHELTAAGVPAPDPAAGGPDLDGVGVLAQAQAHGVAQLPRAVDLVAPGVGVLAHLQRELVGVAVAGGAAEAQAGGVDARALHDAHVDQVADGDAVAADLADGGEAVGQRVVALLDGAGLLLRGGLDDPVVVVVGEVAREVQVGVDKAGHDRLAGAVLDLVAVGDLGAGAGVGDLLAVDEDEGVVDRRGAGAVHKTAAHECELAHECFLSLMAGRVPASFDLVRRDAG